MTKCCQSFAATWQLQILNGMRICVGERKLLVAMRMLGVIYYESGVFNNIDPQKRITKMLCINGLQHCPTKINSS